MCAACWTTVPPALRREVYLTVDQRSPERDASWAPWWRAQANAIAAAAVASGHFSDAQAEAYREHHERIAASMEAP